MDLFSRNTSETSLRSDNEFVRERVTDRRERERLSQRVTERERKEQGRQGMTRGGGEGGALQPSAMFVYGSLQSSEVLQILLHRVPLRRRAQLKGYKRFAVPRRTYPGIAKVARGSGGGGEEEEDDGSAVVNGLVLLGLTERDVAILDEFEGEEYERITETVRLVEEDRDIQAGAYAYLGYDPSSVQYADWSYEHFEKHHLSDFIQSFEGFSFEGNHRES